VFREGKWVQLYNSTDAGNVAYSEANVKWIQRFYAGVKKILSRKGVPMLLTPNWVQKTALLLSRYRLFYVSPELVLVNDQYFISSSTK
jgi:hypothetical protein